MSARLEADAAADAGELTACEDELCRRSLGDYVQRCYPSFALSPWQLDLCEKLRRFVESIERGESPRLMVHVPPQCGKTTIVSRAFVAWVAGGHPEWDGIMASYAQSMSRKNSRWVRNRLRSAEHRRIFPACELAEDSQSIEDMNLSTGAQVISRGVGGGAAGNPAMWVVVDDPFADREAADSPVIREKVDDWYVSTAMSRLGPGAGVLIMHTRWHVDDLAGRLLERADRGRGDPFVDQWTVFSYPAEATGKERRDFYHWEGPAGYLLSRFRPIDLKRKKANMPPRDWLSLFQQTPIVEGGGFFQLKNLRYGQPESLKHVYAAWDLAVTEEQLARGDYSVGAVLGLDHLGRYWLLEVRRGRWASDELVEQIIDTMVEWEPLTTWMEGGPLGLAVMPWLKRRMRERTVHARCVMVSPGGKSKAARAGSIRAVIESGNLFIPIGATWAADLRAELALFPQGKHDDQVDALAWLGLQIPKMIENHPTPAQCRAVNPQKITGDGLEAIERAISRTGKR